MGGNIVETVIGAVVIAFATIFLVFAYQTADIGAADGGVELIAKFDRIDGLQIGSDVRISGIKVGTVIEQEIDPESYLAIVTMSRAKASPFLKTRRQKSHLKACLAAITCRSNRAELKICSKMAMRSLSRKDPSISWI